MRALSVVGGHAHARVGYAVLVFLALVYSVFIVKPRYVFDSDGNVRPFGVADRNNASVFAAPVVTMVAATVAMMTPCVLLLASGGTPPVPVRTF